MLMLMLMLGAEDQSRRIKIDEGVLVLSNEYSLPANRHCLLPNHTNLAAPIQWT
jgi:hypothetical protein